MATLEELRNERLQKLEKLKNKGVNPYPPNSKVTHKVGKVLEEFESLEGEELTVGGFVTSLREHGEIMFADVEDSTGNIQLYLKKENLQSADYSNSELKYEDLNLLDRGDYIQATGVVTTTKTGEKSVEPSNIRILSKALRPLPDKWHGLKDKETRLRRRYIDTKINKEVYERFLRRAKFWDVHRQFFREKGFHEINIPVLEHTPGGADAKPFLTHMDALNQDFYLRISQELFLKRLIGGAYEKVYEIGPRFRNEGISDEHLPEHIGMEFYWAYASWEEGRKMVEELFQYILDNVYGGQTKFEIRGFEVDFSKPWETIDFTEVMEKKYGIDVFDTNLKEINGLLDKNNIATSTEENLHRRIDKLWKEIRKEIAGPAFLINHPKFLSPLAKSHPDNPEIVERFQPIIAGSELGNGWSEINDPQDQLKRFRNQQKLRDEGDEEAQFLDIDYVEMLEYGMPPTFGYGHSERVFWFLEDVPAREGIPFPQMRYELDETTKKIYDVFEETSMEHEVKEDIKEITQDFSQKMTIVVDRDLEEWQVLNTVGHISAYLGNKMEKEFDTGKYFTTKDGKKLPRNTQYPIIVLSAKNKDLDKLLDKVRETDLLHMGFIQEMIDTTDDKEITKILQEKEDEEIDYLGVGIFGEKEEVDELTKRFSLWK